ERLRETITKGIPEGGMPAFTLAAAEMNALVTFISALRAPAADHPTSGDPAQGKLFFQGKGDCLRCHTLNGGGGVLGPDLSNLGRERTLAQITVALRNPEALKTPGYRPVKVKLRDGRVLEGVAKNESNYDLELQESNGALHFFPKAQIANETFEPK